ncbi:MAG: transglycosylase SLT domain-containing protein [Cellvibrionaceae bacterium]
MIVFYRKQAHFIVFTLFFVLALPSMAHDPYREDSQWVDMIIRESLVLNYPPELALAVAKVGSNFKHVNRGRKARIGLMQIPSEAGLRYGAPDYCLYDAAINVRSAIKYLTDLEADLGDLSKALTHYRYDLKFISKSRNSAYSFEKKHYFSQKVLSYFLKYQKKSAIQERIEKISKSKNINKDTSLKCKEKTSVIPMSQIENLQNKKQQIKSRYELIRMWESIYD